MRITSTVRALTFGAALATLAGCAGASFTQLDPSTLAARSGAPDGAVYYLPKPYLLVALLPTATPSQSGPSPVVVPPPPSGGGDAAPPHVSPSFGAAPLGGAAAAEPAKAEGAAPTLGSTDMSFGAVVGNYIIKLVYLPDRSRPMSMSVRSGLFGTGTLKPQLANGWMLTSFEPTVDSNGFADLLTAAMPLLTGGAAEPKGGNAPGPAAPSASPNANVLRPGLYDFDYDDATGRLTRICAVTYFSEQGAMPGTC